MAVKPLSEAKGGQPPFCRRRAIYRHNEEVKNLPKGYCRVCKKRVGKGVNIHQKFCKG